MRRRPLDHSDTERWKPHYVASHYIVSTSLTYYIYVPRLQDITPLDICTLWTLTPRTLYPRTPPGHNHTPWYIYPQDIYSQTLKCPILLMHHVLIDKYCIYVAEIAFICFAGTMKLPDIFSVRMIKSLQLLRL